MVDELGRELTSAERLAVALGETTILDIVHGVAQELDAERDTEIAMVMPSGTVITRGALWREMRAVRAPRPVRIVRGPLVIGLNASSNMFA